MDYSTWNFWQIMLPFTCVLLIVSHNLRFNSVIRQRFDKISLSCLSILLLSVVSWTTVLIFLLVSLSAYAGCLYGQYKSAKQKNILLAILIVFLLLPLLYYKYSNFIVNGILGKDFDTLRDIIIPIGISFYTFQIIAFCIDTLKRNQTVPSFIDYLNFCSFFPQIVAGPIERKDNLLPQMQQMKWQFISSAWVAGIPYVILGLFFKLVMADNLAAGMIPGYEGENAFQVWVNNLIFSFRIYFDFAGYGLTAYGLAKCLN